MRLIVYLKLEKAVETVIFGLNRVSPYFNILAQTPQIGPECPSIWTKKSNIEQQNRDHEAYLVSYKLAAMRLLALSGSSSSKTEETKAVPAKRHLSDPICSHSRILEVNSHAAGPAAGHSAFSPCHPNLIPNYRSSSHSVLLSTQTTLFSWQHRI